MSEEEIIDILQNVICDEVIGTYCLEIQKTTNCAKNCENEDCYLIQAIENLIKRYKELETGLNNAISEQTKLTRENTKFKKENHELKHENKRITDEYMIQKHLINADFLKDYISKDKIREKIKEYNKLREEMTPQDKLERLNVILNTYKILEKYDYNIDVLQKDLLKHKGDER